jgi:hypothetical protein
MTTIAELQAMTRQELEADRTRLKAEVRRIADKAVSLYVPIVHSTALLTFLGWWLSGLGLRESILIAVSTLIITCPCALALAAPVVQVVAAGRLFRGGDGLPADPRHPAVVDPEADRIQRVTDLLAGMTDRYCIAHFTDLYVPERSRL